MKLNDRNIQTYLGQRSAYDPGSLYLGKGVSAAQKCSFLLNKGRTGLDGKYVGTGAVHYTLTGGYGVSSISWDAGDGHTYDIVYECNSSNAGTLVYYKDGGARTAIPYTQYLDQAGAAYSALPTYPTHFKPMFQMYNDVVYMAAGQIGDFRIFARNGTLYAQLTNMPPTNFMLIADNRSYVAVGNETLFRWSAPNEPERYIPKLSEISAGTYGIDYRLTGRSEGTSGNTVGCLTYGPGKFFWSQDECFCIYGDGYNESTTFLRSGRGYGMNGLNSAYVKDGVLYWPSKYKGGELLALTFGSSGPAGAVLEKVVTEKNVRIAIFSTGEKISDVFQAMPQMDSRLHTVAWDTRQDWENIPAAQRTNLSTDDSPGNIQINYVDTSVSSAVLTIKTENLGTGSIAATADHLIDKTHDGDTDTYLNIDGVLGTEYDLAGALGKFEYYSAGWHPMTLNIVEGTGTYTFPTPVTCATFRWTLIVPFINTNTFVVGHVYHYLQYTMPVARYENVTITGFDFTRTNDYTYNIKVYEVAFSGASSSTATLYTELPLSTSKAVLQLAANDPAVQTDMGRFFASFVGTSDDGTGGLAFYIRAGSTPYASLASGTGNFAEDGITFTGDGDDFSALGVQVGDTIVYGSATRYIASVGTTTLTISSPATPGGYTYNVYGCAKASWSNWTTVSTTITDKNNYLVGYDLKELDLYGTSNPVLPSTAGLLYVQAKVVFTLSEGESPLLDAMFFTGYSGGVLTSISPMGIYDDKLCISILGNSSSTRPDTEIIKYDDGEFSVIDGKCVTDYLHTHDGKLYAATGYTYSENFAGSHNYTGADATTETALRRLWRGEDHTGNLYGGKLRVEIGEYTPDSALTPTTGVDVGTAVPLLDWATAYGSSWLGFSHGDPGLSVQANDGNVYLIMSYIDATYPKLDLIKITPSLITTRTNIYTSALANASQLPASICLSNDGVTVYMFWTGNTTVTRTQAWFNTYNVLSGTLGTAAKVQGSDLPASGYRGVSSAVAENGDIYCSFCHDTTTDTWYIYRSTNGGLTWVQDNAITGSVATADKHLLRNRHGYVSLIGQNTAGYFTIFERTAVGWGSETIITTEYNTNNYAITLGGADYVVTGNNNGGYFYDIYKNDGDGWTLVKQITTTSGYFANMLLMTVYNNLIILFYTNSGGSESIITGSGETWSDEYAVEGLDISGGKVIPRCIAGQTPWLMWGIVATSYWKPYVITTGDMTGIYPLEISVRTDTGNLTAYSSSDVITQNTLLPQSRRMPKTGKTTKLGIEISGYGQAKAGSLQYTFFEEK